MVAAIPSIGPPASSTTPRGTDDRVGAEFGGDNKTRARPTCLLAWLESAPWWMVISLVISVAFLARWATAAQFHSPNYTDTAYYTLVARTTVRGGGLTDHGYWNYLSAFSAINHPSNGYWQPLVSLTVVPFFALFGVNFAAAEVAPIIASIALASLSFWIGYRLLGDRWSGLLVAGWSVFGGFYAAHATFPDTFSLYGLIGAASIAATLAGMRGSRTALLMAGALAGLGVLTRSDGALLFIALCIGWGWSYFVVDRRLLVGSSVTKQSSQSGVAPGPQWLIASLALGLVCIAPWAIRNVVVFGGWSPPGSGRVLFLTEYNDLLRWHIDVVTWQRFLGQGWHTILLSRLHAVRTTAFTLAVATELFWLPFVAWGVWCCRSKAWMAPVSGYVVCMVAAMIVVLPFPAEHGTLIHSFAPIEPWVGVLGIFGLRDVLRRVGRGHVMPRYELLGMVYAALFSAGMVWLASTQWYAHRPSYATVETSFLSQHARAGEPVLVIDPPVFEYETGRPGLILPFEGPTAALEVARQYGARYVIWDTRKIDGKDPYVHFADDGRFIKRAALGGVEVYEIP